MGDDISDRRRGAPEAQKLYHETDDSVKRREDLLATQDHAGCTAAPGSKAEQERSPGYPALPGTEWSVTIESHISDNPYTTPFQLTPSKSIHQLQETPWHPATSSNVFSLNTARCGVPGY